MYCITLHYNKFVFDLSFLFQAGFLAPFILLKARKFVLLYTMGSLFTIGRFVNTLQSIECLNCCIPPPIIEGFFRKRIFLPSTVTAICSPSKQGHSNPPPLPQPTITIVTQALPTLSEYTHCHHLDYYHNFESCYLVRVWKEGSWSCIPALFKWDSHFLFILLSRIQRLILTKPAFREQLNTCTIL